MVLQLMPALGVQSDIRVPTTNVSVPVKRTRNVRHRDMIYLSLERQHREQSRLTVLVGLNLGWWRTLRRRDALRDPSIPFRTLAQHRFACESGRRSDCQGWLVVSKALYDISRVTDCCRTKTIPPKWKSFYT